MIIMSDKDETYILVKETYNQMSAYDLDEAGLPHVFDLLTSQQKDFFMNFLTIAQTNFRESYDPSLRDEFYSNVTDQLGYKGCDAVEDIIDQMGVKICKY